MNDQITVVCDCGKQVNIKNYKGNVSPYRCNNCRGIVHKFDSCPEIFEEVDDKGKSVPLIIKKNGYINKFCKQMHQFVNIRTCKTCKEGR